MTAEEKQEIMCLVEDYGYLRVESFRSIVGSANLEVLASDTFFSISQKLNEFVQEKD